MNNDDINKYIAPASGIISGALTTVITGNAALGITVCFGTYAVIDKMSNESSKPDQPVLTSKRSSSNTLVLIINGRNKGIINKFKIQDNIIKGEDCDDLYSMTQALWIGSEKDFKESLLSKGFDTESEFALSQAEATEYDVYFLKIQLNESIAGFSRVADQGARLNAFRELADYKVTISPALLPNAYENCNVYSS